MDDFIGIGNAVWNFISSIYDANWDALFTNNKSNTFRKKITAKFTPRICTTLQKNLEKLNKFTPASIKRILLPIPAKSQKEVNIISKFFKNKKSEKMTFLNTKSYAQASKQNISMSDIIKIKETFPSIGTKKINQINDIVKESSKPKSHIQMTTKGPSKKQIIILMDNENNTKFMKNSSIHIANINRNLRNTKSEVLADFIYSDPLGVTIVTNKISLPSNLLVIENYVRNLENINSSQVDSPHLS